MSNPESSGDEMISFETSDVPHVLSQIARLGEGLKAEFDLIAGRMTWLVISESFIGFCDCDCKLPARPPGRWHVVVPDQDLVSISLNDTRDGVYVCLAVVRLVRTTEWDNRWG